MRNTDIPITTPAGRPAARSGRSGFGLALGGTGTALILLGFVVLPGAILGILSWRAIQNERSISLERLRESYRKFAVLAARQIDYQLRSVEARWIGELDRVMNASAGGPGARQVAEASGRDPLIAGYILLGAPGRVLYPPLHTEEMESAPVGAEQASDPAEHDLFTRLVSRGEHLEYRAGDLKGALESYREIIARVESPRLEAMALSYIGRIQLKAGDPEGALRTWRHLLDAHPNERDMNRMYLRFLAQYQIAVALDELRRYPEALDALLELNRDLLKRSDAITRAQYSYFSDLIRSLAPRILERPGVSDKVGHAPAFQALGDQIKKRISEKHYVHLLSSELSEMAFRRRRFHARTQYLSARAEGEPFLLAYRAVPDDHRDYITGILAAEIDLGELQKQLFAALRNLNAETHGAVAILGSGGNVILGAEAAKGTWMATQELMAPFDFWQVAIYVDDVPGAMQRIDLQRTLVLWLVSLLVLSILFGGYAFIMRARREARLSRAQTTFVSNVSHELRTPLTSIRMFAELLELEAAGGAPGKQPSGPPNAGPYAGIIRMECDRLSRLIDRVIDFSRTERGASQYRFEPNDVRDVVARSVEAFRPNADAHQFRLELTAEPALPQVSLDPDAIEQVMLNLFTNAVQFSNDEREIRVHVGRDAAGVAIAVSDRGIGIAPGDLNRVFDRFYSTWRRMDSRSQGGLGLGLTLSREIVRAHGGEIRVRSEVGRGSTFTVILPASVVARGDPGRPAADVPALGRVGGGHS